MVMAESEEVSLQIVGLITSIAYQKAKYYLQICSRLPHIYPKQVSRGLLEFDWFEYLTKQRRKFGGQIWALKRPVVVFYNNKFIGSDKELLKLLYLKYSFSSLMQDTYFRNQCIRDYESYIFNKKRIFVYISLSIENCTTGLLIFQLYSDLLPTTCEIFKNYCANKTYQSTHFHRLCKHGWIQGGASEDGLDIGKPCEIFPDESFCISHNRRGVLSMVNDGRHTNCKQFFITLQPSQWMDYRYVAFGQLVEGVDVLSAMENVETYYEKPLKSIKIVDCGVLNTLNVLPPLQTVGSFVDAALEAVALRTTPPTLESMPEQDVVDLRDADSVPSLRMYNEGMYSLQTESDVELVSSSAAFL